jgi:hypothetical protein
VKGRLEKGLASFGGHVGGYGTVWSSQLQLIVWVGAVAYIGQHFDVSDHCFEKLTRVVSRQRTQWTVEALT